MKQTKNFGQCSLRKKAKRNETMKHILFYLSTNFCFVTYETNETDLQPWPGLIMKQDETKWNDEIDTILITNETNKIYKEKSEIGWNRQKTLINAHYKMKQNETMQQIFFYKIISVS